MIVPFDEICASPFCGNPATRSLQRHTYKENPETGQIEESGIEWFLCDRHYEMATEVYP